MARQDQVYLQGSDCVEAFDQVHVALKIHVLPLTPVVLAHLARGTQEIATGEHPAAVNLEQIAATADGVTGPGDDLEGEILPVDGVVIEGKPAFLEVRQRAEARIVGGVVVEEVIACTQQVSLFN